jgi:hypothetical protein
MPEARISPEVIFIGRARAGMPYDSHDRASGEVATGWARRHLQPLPIVEWIRGEHSIWS